jgi:hypothetical protein
LPQAGATSLDICKLQAAIILVALVELITVDLLMTAIL